MIKNTCKVLVVEDNPDIGDVISMILENKGYAVVVFKNADGIQELLQDDQVDIIIMDMLLSGVNGTDICKKIKEDPALSPIPLIMMSAHPDAENICIKAGADDFVAKPFDLEDLLFKIAHFTNARPVSGNNIN